MELSGGSWLWSASLRYFFMVPFLIAIVAYRKGLGQTKKEMITKPAPFFIWSVVAFVLFYAPLTYAAAYSPGWLLAGTWQLTIVAGVLLAPFFTLIVKTNDGEAEDPAEDSCHFTLYFAYHSCRRSAHSNPACSKR